MKILYVAEIVGRAGIFAIKKELLSLKEKLNIDFVIACADGATGAKGLGRNHASYLKKLGCDVITLGDFCFSKKDLVDDLASLPYVLRPSNFSGAAPGCGSYVFKNKKNQKIAVLVLLGQSGFVRLHSENPLFGLKETLSSLRAKTPFVIIDYHASASAEKQTLFYALDGECSAIIGSHSRVATADERILTGGTAVITDAGRTGSQYSVGGCEILSEVNFFLSGIPQWKKEAWDCSELQGLVIELDPNGKALKIERLRKTV
ncbi:MAG: TIGR00282 family metallophosphoesterase [Termitinemataceae bacterium]|nr:MAG: TIGR00282 family metallophosphoesterase [Termitinemataceae bacterium]